MPFASLGSCIKVTTLDSQNLCSEKRNWDEKLCLGLGRRIKVFKEVVFDVYERISVWDFGKGLCLLVSCDVH